MWNLSTELDARRILLISCSSLLFISFFVQTTYRHSFTFSSQRRILARVLAVYGITLLVAATTLYAIDRLPLLTDTEVAIRRAVIVAFPASFSATVVDSLGD